MTVRATGWFWDERCMWHDTGTYAGTRPSGGWLEPYVHLENADAKRRLRNLVEVSGLLAELVPIAGHAATVDELCRVHDHAYVERIAALAGLGGGAAGDGTPIGGGSYEIATVAAGGVMAATDAVLDGEIDNAYALVRPPGHHALRDAAMGFCVFANIAVAVRHAQEARGVGRVAIVDWDVHHGNGTQAAFYDDPSVLTISVHQANAFPHDSGGVDEVGAGPGVGANVNVALPPGCGTGAYVAAFERVVVPAVRAFAPELVVVGCGFDAAGMDPLGRMLLHSESYRSLTTTMLDLAAECCDGRLVFAHEGGYSAHVVPFCGLAVMETLAGRRTAVEDPFLPMMSGGDGQELLPHQLQAIDRAARSLERVPRGT